MTANIADALAAYAGAASRSGPGMEPRESAGSGFAEMLKDAVSETVAKGREADALSAAAIDGKAGVVEVVTAVAEAEVALQTMVTVRDRVVQAYQDIISMPI